MFFPGVIRAQENPLTKAIQLFDKKKFTEAEEAFKKLIDAKPGDFMINYFYGACRTENGHYSDEDLNYLEIAGKEVYPIDIDYYFGVQYHAKNLFNKALIHYNSFRKVASDDEIKRVSLAEKIDFCEQRINPFKTEDLNTKTDSVKIAETTPEETIAETGSSVLPAAPAVVEIESKTENDSLKAETIAAEATETSNKTSDTVQIAANDKQTDTTAEIVSEPEKPIPSEPVIKFNINDEITYIFESQFKTAEGSAYFKDGNKKQEELDKLALRTEILRGNYSNSKTKAEKDSLGLLIVDLENEIYQLKGMTRQAFIQARNSENNYWQNATAEEKEKFIAEVETIENAIAKEKSEEKETPVTGILISPLLVEDAPVEKPVKEVKSTGINYKIQLGAFSKGIPNNLKPVFKKIMIIRKVENYIDEKGVVVYTTGNLNTYNDALVMLNQVKQEGVKDAIIAAYQNGKRITLEQAKETEKQK